MHKLGVAEIKNHSQRQIQVEPDAERSNPWFLWKRKEPASAERCVHGDREPVALFVSGSRCETGTALVHDESVSANPELCQGFQVALVGA
jgi:hypothetical protein